MDSNTSHFSGKAAADSPWTQKGTSSERESLFLSISTTEKTNFGFRKNCRSVGLQFLSPNPLTFNPINDLTRVESLQPRACSDLSHGLALLD